MEKVKALFRKINEKLAYQVSICIVLMLLVFSAYFFLARKIDRMIEVHENDYTWVYQVDSAEQQGKKLVLQGWAFKLKQDAQEETYEIVFQDVNTQKRHFFDMEYSERKDVNEYFLCEYDYSKSGFTATIPLRKLDMTDGIYEVLLRPKDVRKAFPTGMYFADGEIQYADPREFVAPEVSGTDLEDVVNDGVLRVYRPDYGTYVYQYEGELYWIVERGYNFDENDYWYVQYQMNTTQVDKLPEVRLENNWFWSNIGFVFTTKEAGALNTDKYRVAKCAVPTDYSVTDIWTGNYVDGWIWKEYFLPWYEGL